jgi:hypothetical protein
MMIGLLLACVITKNKKSHGNVDEHEYEREED